MSQRVTLRDVATYAGVSVTTVSNVVRDWPYVAEETRLRVQEAIAKLGYSPHPIAQGLRTGQTQALGFVVPELSNPHFAAMVSVAENVAQEHAYSLIVFNSQEDEPREAQCIRRASNRMVDGLLIAQVANSHHTTELLNTLSIPVVAIDRLPDKFSGAACSLDNVQAGRLATEHLCQQGHQCVAHLAGPSGARPARDRVEGYLSVLDRYGLVYRRVLHSDDSWGCDEGYRMMRELLQDDERPTAVFASNDLVAIGAFHAISEAGLSVPGDISLVGVDDIEVSAHINPPLTTVRQPLESLARAGIDLLLKLIHDDHSENTQLTLEPMLIVRKSTAPPQ
jgi:LacI family transcriptional regulator